jgi:glucose-6-phosphate isomerase
MLKMLSKSRLVNGETGFSIDFSGMKISDAGLEAISDKLAAAHVEMGEIEAGAVKNIDEQRKVTHFTDRAEYPSSEIFRDVEAFAADVAEGTIKGSTGKKFDALILNGIGGSALGPQLLQFAINGPVWNELAPDERRGFLRIYFTDNTDTAGVADAMKTMDLETTLVLSVSKSGGTQETKNNMIAFEKLYADAGIDFAEHACAITMPGSQLDKHASSNGWMKIFPMAESIGGRTSETSASESAALSPNLKVLAEGYFDFSAAMCGGYEPGLELRRGQVNAPFQHPPEEFAEEFCIAGFRCGPIRNRRLGEEGGEHHRRRHSGPHRTADGIRKRHL